MEQTAVKPKKKIDRSKKKRKVRSNVTFDVALGHKDLRTKSHAASHKQHYGKPRIPVRINLPENRTYTMPSSSSEDEEDYEISEEEIKEEFKFDIDTLRNTKVTEFTELEKEYFVENRLEKLDKSLNKISEKSEKTEDAEKPNVESGAEAKVENETLDEELESLLNLKEPCEPSVVKHLTFTAKEEKPKWKTRREKTLELEKYLDSILEDL